MLYLNSGVTTTQLKGFYGYLDESGDTKVATFEEAVWAPRASFIKRAKLDYLFSMLSVFAVEYDILLPDPTTTIIGDLSNNEFDTLWLSGGKSHTTH